MRRNAVEDDEEKEKGGGGNAWGVPCVVKEPLILDDPTMRLRTRMKMKTGEKGASTRSRLGIGGGDRVELEGQTVRVGVDVGYRGEGGLYSDYNCRGVVFSICYGLVIFIIQFWSWWSEGNVEVKIGIFRNMIQMVVMMERRWCWERVRAREAMVRTRMMEVLRTWVTVQEETKTRRREP
jgi:hypothetical protein